MKRLNVAVTKLTGRVSRSRIAHRRAKSWVPGWRCVDIHENRIQPAASLPAEGPKHSKKSNFPWRRGRALQQVPFHSVLEQVHRRHCFNAQRRGLLWEEQKAPLSRFASPYYQRCHMLSLSSGTLHRPTVSFSPKKRLILVGVSAVVEKRNKKKSPNFPDNRRILALGWFLSLCRRPLHFVRRDRLWPSNENEISSAGCSLRRVNRLPRGRFGRATPDIVDVRKGNMSGNNN